MNDNLIIHNDTYHERRKHKIRNICCFVCSTLLIISFGYSLGIATCYLSDIC